VALKNNLSQIEAFMYKLVQLNNTIFSLGWLLISRTN